jgi:hypothetical protein
MQQRRFDFQEPKEALWQKGGRETFVNVGIREREFGGRIWMDVNQQLHYRVAIPYSAIGERKPEDLVLGIRIPPTTDVPQNPNSGSAQPRMRDPATGLPQRQSRGPGGLPQRAQPGQPQSRTASAPQRVSSDVVNFHLRVLYPEGE